MIAAIHPMGAVVVRPRFVPVNSPGALNNEHVLNPQAPIVISQDTPANGSPSPTVPASQSVASTPSGSSSSSSSAGSSSVASAPASASVASAPVAQMVSGIVDPATGITYSGYLTPDAQTLYNSGGLLQSGNELTTQGSALAAQGDLITGTPAPTTAQVAAAAAATTTTVTAGTDPWTEFTTWLSAETYWPGVPNGALAAGAVILGSLLLGKKKGRR